MDQENKVQELNLYIIYFYLSLDPLSTTPTHFSTVSFLWRSRRLRGGGGSKWTQNIFYFKSTVP